MAAPQADFIIHVSDLVARYGDRTILDGVSFTIRRGEICAILGGSGCGKSTLLKHLIGLLRPASGSILIDGEEMRAAFGERLQAMRRKMGVLFQMGALFGSLTIGENIALPLEEYTDLSSEQIASLVRFKLALVGLAGFEDHTPAELSGGMRKRAALARAMALDPQILFFDEMSAGLDPVTSAELDRLVQSVSRSLGLTIILVTHELASINAIADHAIMLETGHIIGEGRPAELAESTNATVRSFFQRSPRQTVESSGIGSWTEVFSGGSHGS
ncbi:MAG: ATP-binding cassette domain-containing protein [Candidatus Schekmanbacteria bacterium]|nr:ATP-binding cassette domain-containing protein [Candidatus Schekmanbacteria bacterium]